VLNRLHRWLGLLLAVFALLSALSGALLLWSDEYYQWRYPALGDGTAEIMPSAGVMAKIVAHSPGAIGTLAMPTRSLPAYRSYLRDGSEALHAASDGSLVDHWAGLERLPALLFELHVRLLGGETGHTVVGIIGLLLAVLLCTGPFLWWPRRRVMRLRRWYPRRPSRPLLINAHAAQGMLLGALIMMLSLTGAAIVFHQQAGALLSGVLGEAGPTRPATRSIQGSATDVDWTAALASAASRFPLGTLRLAMLPREPGDPLVLRVRQPGEWHPNGRSYLVLRPDNGKVLEQIDATRTGRGPAVYNALYPLHAGKTGWPGYRAVLLAASLALGFMALSALWAWARRRRAAEPHAATR
jgi:uncharacterized iron-regulated membrane protein